MTDEHPPRDPREMSTEELLIQVNQQLAMLREQNDRLIQILSDESSYGDEYKCLSCGDHVSEDERESHQVRKHNAPPSGIDLTGEYSPL